MFMTHSQQLDILNSRIVILSQRLKFFRRLAFVIAILFTIYLGSSL